VVAQIFPEAVIFKDEDGLLYGEVIDEGKMEIHLLKNLWQ
jgi:hypothetical protein